MADRLIGAQAVAAERGHVYIIAEKDGRNKYTGYYKIGKTKQDPSERLRELQTGNPRKLEYFRHVEVSDIDAAERAAHTAVTRKRYEGGGTEWYFAGPTHQSEFQRHFELAIIKF